MLVYIGEAFRPVGGKVSVPRLPHTPLLFEVPLEVCFVFLLVLLSGFIEAAEEVRTVLVEVKAAAVGTDEEFDSVLIGLAEREAAPADIVDGRVLAHALVDFSDLLVHESGRAFDRPRLRQTHADSAGGRHGRLPAGKGTSRIAQRRGAPAGSGGDAGATETRRGGAGARRAPRPAAPPVKELRG